MKELLFILCVFLINSWVVEAQSEFSDKLSESAMDLTKQKVQYDPRYYQLKYPGGDVPPDRGVCTDVIIRAYRRIGVDLQKEVHEDMSAHFSAYPKHWNMRHTDKNIDHRRVLNLMTFFKRNGIEKSISAKSEDYLPGDIVCWDLGGGILHIGIVVNKSASDGKRHLIVHNIGSGQVLEDCLFRFKIIGHFRYEKYIE